MYAQNTLQMEWCLDCHRNPAKNLRPASEIYNMAWESPAADRPVWCASKGGVSGVPTAQSVSCTTKDPASTPQQLASLNAPTLMQKAALVSDALVSDSDTGMAALNQPMGQVQYHKFTSQDELGHFLLDQYKIRPPKDLASCEVCHR
jgi:hypothetical protein